MIKTSLRILLVEDFKTDAELIEYNIRKIVEKPEIRLTDNLDQVSDYLRTFVPDVILSDYNLPACSGLDVLKLAKSIDDSIPFIFITGTIDDDEMAANTILSGASGFILKKHMNTLDEKLRPLLKQVVFNMVQKEELRENIRKNKIAVNQIYQYLDNINADNEEQRKNISKIKANIDQINLERDVE
ncbi:Response regulator receiver domain-containing protein [Gillisia sp. Hel1_33_143]|uniref:response regulator n=1 Tax=unclassified Gillisia TaxID=2615025 RepID=UPI000550AF88|nr:MULTISPECIES: response regulator [unclassified Gillisia]SDS77161.1 Response regulator receiver domain-containing protein [Gillisia sp. Hel1_33_143]